MHSRHDMYVGTLWNELCIRTCEENHKFRPSVCHAHVLWRVQDQVTCEVLQLGVQATSTQRPCNVRVDYSPLLQHSYEIHQIRRSCEITGRHRLFWRASQFEKSRQQASRRIPVTRIASSGMGGACHQFGNSSCRRHDSSSKVSAQRFFFN